MNKTFLLKILNSYIDYKKFKKSIKNIKKKDFLEKVDIDIINNSSINDNDDIPSFIIINILKLYYDYPDIIKYILWLQQNESQKN